MTVRFPITMVVHPQRIHPGPAQLGSIHTLRQPRNCRPSSTVLYALGFNGADAPKYRLNGKLSLKLLGEVVTIDDKARPYFCLPSGVQALRGVVQGHKGSPIYFSAIKMQ